MNERIEGRFIPDSYISAGYLRRCFERRGGKSKGFIAEFLLEHARFGRKKVHNGMLGEILHLLRICRMLLEAPGIGFLIGSCRLISTLPSLVIGIELGKIAT